MRVCVFALVFVLAALLDAHAASLIERFDKLSCAVVHIQAEGSSGTGAFIDDKGDVLTAAHVAYDRSYANHNGEIIAAATLKNNLTIIDSKGIGTPISSYQVSPNEIVNSKFDLAIIDTSLKPPCFIGVGDPKSLKIGARLLAIGFPTSSPTGVLYEGFLSARHAQLHTLGPIEGQPNQVAQNTYDVMRVQMPITPGASGSPLIDENDQIVGVIAEIPVLALKDIADIIRAYLSSGPRSSFVMIGGFDTNKVLAELALMVTEFESPGSGLAVPVEYLKR